MMTIEISYRGAVIRFEPESATETTEGVMATKLCAARRAIDQALDLDEPKDKSMDYDEGIEGEDYPPDQVIFFNPAPGNPPLPMPSYECRHRVRAAKIIAFSVLDRGVAALTISLSSYSKAFIETREGWTDRFRGSDDDLGYNVQHEDGFTSWSPTEAFEDGYHRVT